MIDNFGREINYLRISVTDRCNLRCRYCMPAEGCVNLIPHSEILSFEEILRLTEAAASIGIGKIRLTGGEPLVRHSIVDLIRRMNQIDGINEIDITTNGVLLADMAEDLKEAGVRRVNISLDTFDADKYRMITRGGDINRVLKGIEAAERVGLTPIKINCVALKGFNDDEFDDFVNLTREKDLRVRFIELMPIGHNDLGGDYGFISNQELLARFPELEPCGPQKFSVADEYRLPGAAGTVGFISALSHHFCAECNKLRLTSDGKIKPCLHSNEEIDVKTVLRNGTDEDVRNLLIESVGHKVAHHMLNEGAGPIDRDMNKIGG
ncbi:MAG: GTP 3',8-cyclase MoaA [Anaerovoracaceae bacterium]|nr:GTP 3',8-cyclase MoaA [Bacillota bacterium]MDY2671091.1 GTP 3',8-cyclase MoaA [Anaerovoracaceae bacterium]